MSFFYVMTLRRLIAATKQNNNNISRLPEVDTITRAVIDLQFRKPFAYGFTSAKISQLQAIDLNVYFSFRSDITYGVEPFYKRRLPVRFDIIFNVLHVVHLKIIVAYKLQKCK